ncbi:MAG: M1 family metallopeptidase, partial [Rhodothermales bacterium]
MCLLSSVAIYPAIAQEIDINSRPERSERSHDFDVLHYRIELSFEEDSRSMFGKTVVTVRALRDGFDQLELDAETFTVTEVLSAKNSSLPFSHQAGVLSIDLDESALYNDTVAVTISYEGNDIRIDPTAYGQPASYAVGIGFKPATEANPQLINTLSFPEGARHWFPSYDHPSDRATQETIITVQQDYQAISNGRLVSITKNDDAGTHTFHWHLEQSHPTYLSVLVAGPYVGIKDTHGDLPLTYWVYPKDKDDAMRSFGKTPEILQFLEDTYGVPYPWVRYDQITIPGIGGGAESTTATVVGESTIHDERADQDFPSHWLVAHEAAHHWWGNMISYRDWTHTWLSESFATFSEYLWSAHSMGPDEGALNLQGKKASYLNEAKNKYMRPIVFDRWEYPNQNFDSHTYPKGAVIVNMMRAYLGEKAFGRVMQHFLTKHA